MSRALLTKKADIAPRWTRNPLLFLVLPLSRGLGHCHNLFGIAALEENSHNSEINKVANHFREGWVAIVTKESLEQLAQNGFFVDDRVHIPNVFDDVGNPADFVEFMNAMRHQPTCEQDENETSDLKEAAQVEADSALSRAFILT